MDLKANLYYKRRSIVVPAKTLISDRKFLIDFIVTTYLGPDVHSDNPRCSVIQRSMAGSPPYMLNDLGHSYVSIPLLERLYYYLLKDSLPDLILDINMLHLYLKGKLFLPSSDFTEDSEQFTGFFPLDLHQQIWYPDSFRIVKGVVLIDDPSTSCINEDDLSRFMSLTGVNTFKLNMSECLRFQLGRGLSKESESNCMNKVPETIPNWGCQSRKFQQEHKRKYVDDTPPIPEFPRVFPARHNANGDPSKKMCKSDSPTMMPLLSIPDIDDCDRDSSVILTGTARRGLFGPSVGVVDIGISKVAYLFRVSLPGVKRDYTGQFSCDIESDGRVHIRGLLTGGRTITKQSRVFQMKIRQLCSPGPFTLSFSLPGPVDPRLFAPNFRPDGIFEGVVVKQ
ncbi:increased DNA methylation 3 [Gastrolobium bilobum]|uniref:increased DNA methylation 3 n=1 Tax=Gastrolobium bilobum TaxID=150636 RepID=UPI002AB052AE|nr:increased DNA methylation 3 [Gastrolobium bilobum]